jgi:hypothetical protein
MKKQFIRQKEEQVIHWQTPKAAANQQPGNLENGRLMPAGSIFR